MLQPKQLRVQGRPIASVFGSSPGGGDTGGPRASLEPPNPSIQELFGHAVQRQEAVVAANGALCVRTGSRTGRSPKDRFIVRDPDSAPHIDWGQINQPFDSSAFDELWQRVMDHMAAHGDHFTSRLQAGADEVHSIPLRVITEYAWHNLFARQLFIEPRNHTGPRPGEWMVVNAPRFKTDPRRDGTTSDGAVIIDLARRRILLAGMKYAGEMKKAVFTVMNYLLPQSGVLPMHCAANVGVSGDVALFFGLSGTGKTTLSADPERLLIGDDEHGWNDEGIFNFEGGCYAKCINLTQEHEPVIWEAIKFGAIMENVVLDHARFPRYEDAALTENTRVAYPREHVENRVEENRAGHPSAILFLTCDLFGVLPPVSVLDERQAAYHFLSGYTALVAGTEVGGDIKPTFSACFGAPFFPRRPVEYAEILMRKLRAQDTPVYLVNTGWTGGGYGSGGHRFPIATTRSIVRAILDGSIRGAPKIHLPHVNLSIPTLLPGTGLDERVLNPRNAWTDADAYDAAAARLARLFTENFKRFGGATGLEDAGPRP